MKLVVYLSMLLLLGPLVEVAGVVVSALFLMVMFGVGLYLIFRAKDRSEDGPQQPAPPHVVVVVPPEQWTWQQPVAPTPPPAEPQAPQLWRGVHPSRRPRVDRPPLWYGNNS